MNRQRLSTPLLHSLAALPFVAGLAFAARAQPIADIPVPAATAQIAPKAAPSSQATADAQPFEALPPGSPASVDEALTEMVELEDKLEAAQQRQFEHEQQLLKAGTALDAAENTARTQQTTSEQGLQLLQAYDDRLGRDQAALQRTIAEGHAELDRRKATLRLARLALLAQADSPAGPQAAALPLALLDQHQRTRSDWARSRILRAETQIATLNDSRTEARQAAGYHGAFSEYSARQLRARHQELAARVAALRTGVDQESQSVTELAARRGELKNLIEKLSEQQTEADAASDFAKTIVTPIPTPQTPSVNADGSGEPRVAIAEIGYEAGSEPLVSQAAPATAPAQHAGAADGAAQQDQTEGTRQLFWRASPVGVRALVAGRVVFSGEVAGYRHLLILDHGEGWHTLYGNMIETQTSEGEVVKVGARLGTYQAGQGRRAEPFVFEVYKGNQPQLPETFPYLADGWQSHLFETVQP